MSYDRINTKCCFPFFYCSYLFSLIDLYDNIIGIVKNIKKKYEQKINKCEINENWHDSMTLVYPSINKCGAP